MHKISWQWLVWNSGVMLPVNIPMLLLLTVHVGVVESAFIIDVIWRKNLSQIFSLICSLDNAGEGSVLPMLRSVRLALGLIASGKLDSHVSSCNGVDAQVHLIFTIVFICLCMLPLRDCVLDMCICNARPQMLVTTLCRQRNVLATPRWCYTTDHNSFTRNGIRWVKACNPKLIIGEVHILTKALPNFKLDLDDSTWT